MPIKVLQFITLIFNENVRGSIISVKSKINEIRENSSEEFSVMDYTRLIPILTKAIQEQQQLIDDLTERLKVLEAKID